MPHVIQSDRIRALVPDQSLSGGHVTPYAGLLRTISHDASCVVATHGSIGVSSGRRVTRSVSVRLVVS